MGQKPPVFLKSGDTIRLGVEGLGVQQQTVGSYQQGTTV
jgi:2-keto-4-pentenoate hydratase/2-oxohepta-3-ene-1,7-dioic acid hydratase in catechol pathway